ncbi:MAG: phosphatidylinositol-specific phospholipase C1-like protein [Verrucomicrobiota bacterium]|nr:phosphatidylinositol-specific phospholipase C1-like protein [Verrucomicrobiota bacterium]
MREPPQPSLVRCASTVLLLFLMPVCLGEPWRLNQMQVIGTHNSYKKAMHPSIQELIRRNNGEAARSLDYAHESLTRQLVDHGMRKMELDVYADPKGGHYADPLGPRMAEDLNLPRVPNHDPEGNLKQPGFKVMHVPDIDYDSNVLTFLEALRELRRWSTGHPRHVPVLVMIELKDSAVSPEGTQPLSMERKDLMALEREILSILPPRHLLRPDDVRGDDESLRAAILRRGWPTLESVRGKIMFALDNTDEKRDLYLQNNPVLQGRVCFVSVEESHPAAAWFKVNDPVAHFERIRSLVSKGFMVRTRADAGTEQARNNDPSQREKAFLSGAQFISTDYPVPNLKWSPYRVRFAKGVVARPNPVSNAAADPGLDLESWLPAAPSIVPDASRRP